MTPAGYILIRSIPRMNFIFILGKLMLDTIQYINFFAPLVKTSLSNLRCVPIILDG